MSIIWCHDLMDHSQIMLSVTQGVTWGALTFEYAVKNHIFGAQHQQKLTFQT